MGKSRNRNKGRRNAPGGFAGIPRVVADHPDFIHLKPYPKVLLLELARQYKGTNNGDLTVAYSVVHARGCGSKV